MSDALAPRLGALAVLDEDGRAIPLGRAWASSPTVLAFVRHFGWIFCRQQVADLAAAQPEMQRHGAGLVVVGPGKPEHLKGFRDVTRYAGPLFADPSLATFRAAGLAHGWGKTFHPRSMWKGLRAFASGFRQGVRRGDPAQQGGLFVLGPGDRVRYEWRDRFAGDHAPLSAVLAALS